MKPEKTLSAEDNLLEIDNISKNFTLHHQGKVIHGCRDISLHVGSGEFVGITGRSGSGKSTILRMIYRTYLPQDGEIRYRSQAFGWISMNKATEQQVLYLRRHEIGYVSQFLQVIPRTTARQIIEQAVRETGADDEQAQSRAQTMLDHFELDPDLHDAFPYTFSGGERLRLGIARAMAQRPRLLLLDEPTASLDNHSKQKVRDLIEQLKAEGTTMLGIFHDLEFMEGLCDREYAMAEGSHVQTN